MKRFLTVVAFCFAIVLLGFAPCSGVCHATAPSTDFSQFFKNLFGDEVCNKIYKPKEVFVSGSPLGFSLLGDGVVVICVGSVESAGGVVVPCEGQNIREGDVLLSIDGVRIESAKTIEEVLNADKDSLSFELVFLRDKKRFVKHVLPAVDVHTNKKRLGLWIRDNTCGVGTLTFVTEDGRFGALGHPVCDVDTGTKMPTRDGSAFLCNIIGVNKGEKGLAGELKGLFVRTANPIGQVFKNNEFGVYGKINQSGMESVSLKKVEVAKRSEVRPGRAQILSTVYGNEPETFDIEIVKTTNQSSSKSKSMVIRIVDDRLLDKTGGIVQGMSGSPILQDGKFVGAVTHVFVSDPTKGFGVYADWMIEQ